METTFLRHIIRCAGATPEGEPDMPFDAHLVVVAGAFAYGLEAMRILSELSPEVHALLDTLAQKLNERVLAGLAEADTLGFIGHAGGAKA